MIYSYKELLNYITDIIKVPEFVLLTVEGGKFSNSNIGKIDDLLKNNSNETLILVLIPKNVIFTVDNNFTSIFIKNKVTNQVKIKKCIDSYYTKVISAILKKVEKLNTLNEKFSLKLIDIPTLFRDNFTKLKEIFINNNQTEFDIIAKAAKEFEEVYQLYKGQFAKVKELSETYINSLSSVLEEKVIYNEESLDKIYILNSQIIFRAIEDDSNKNKKDLVEILSEVNLYRKNLEHYYEIINIPSMFLSDTSEIENEIQKRQSFDMIYRSIMDYVENTLISNEEKRRKEFTDKMRQNNKTELYLKIIESYYKDTKIKIGVNSDSLPLVNQLKNNFEQINSFLFDSENNHKNYVDNNNISIIRNDLKKILSDNFKYEVDDNKDTIPSMIQYIYDKTKNYDVSFSNNSSLAYSIFLDDNKAFPSTGNLLKRNSSLTLNKNIGIEKIVTKFEDKVFFYDNLYDYIIKYLTKINSKHIGEIKKENPQSLGDEIERIIKENFSLKTKYTKLLLTLERIKK